MSNCSHMYCCTGSLCMRDEVVRLTKRVDEAYDTMRALVVEKARMGTDLINLRLEKARILGIFGDYEAPCLTFEQADAVWNALKNRITTAENKLRDTEKLVNSMRTANLQLIQSEMQLKDELARLKPPEPKFGVGQIVVRVDTGNAYTVHQRELLAGGQWGYSNTRPGYGRPLNWDCEANFRAQTAEERGI